MEDGERADHKDKLQRSSAFTGSTLLRKNKNGITKTQPKRITLEEKHLYIQKNKNPMVLSLSSPQALFLDTAAKEVCRVLSCTCTSMNANHSKHWVSL